MLARFLPSDYLPKIGLGLALLVLAGCLVGWRVNQARKGGKR
jgi:hypothetical protein